MIRPCSRQVRPDGWSKEEDTQLQRLVAEEGSGAPVETPPVGDCGLRRFGRRAGDWQGKAERFDTERTAHSLRHRYATLRAAGQPRGDRTADDAAKVPRAPRQTRGARALPASQHHSVLDIRWVGRTVDPQAGVAYA